MRVWPCSLILFLCFTLLLLLLLPLLLLLLPLLLPLLLLLLQHWSAMGSSRLSQACYAPHAQCQLSSCHAHKQRA